MAASHSLHIRILSDLHLELGSSYKLSHLVKPVTKTSEHDIAILVLAGDIGCPFSSSYRQLLTACRPLFDYVMVIAGNHEYYKAPTKVTQSDGTVRTVKSLVEMSAVEAQMALVCAETGCICLQNTMFDLGPTLRIAGATLWAALPPNLFDIAPDLINDFGHIQLDGQVLTPEQYAALHTRDVAFLSACMAQCTVDNKRLIVVTHHGASYQLLRYGAITEPHDYCYASQVPQLLQPPVCHWISGHTHRSMQVVEQGITITLNCRGYQGQKGTNYDPNLTVTLPL